jgi:predicted TIM-barrel fold metal-dependent hydrolase
MTAADGTEHDSRITVVDPHIHLWDTRQVRYPWLEHRQVAFSGDNRLLPDPYTVATFLQDAQGIEVRMSVHVEANPADPLAEVQWLQSMADDPENLGHPHGIVAYLDLTRSDAPVMLDALAAYRNVRGIRQILNVHQDARYSYLDRHLLMNPLWRANLRRLMQYEWSFDLQIYPSQAGNALHVIDSAEDLSFILNHTGMFVDRDQVSGWRQWRQALSDLAARSNVVIKISGLAMFDHHWTIESFRPYVLEAIDVFGVERCMFASNFPIDGLHSQYEVLWRAYAQIVAGASVREREHLFSSNAIRYYSLRSD